MKQPPKKKSLERIGRCLDQISQLRSGAADSPALGKWRRDTEVAISNTFPSKEEYLERFQRIHYYPMFAPSSAADRQESFLSGLQSAENMLASMVSEIEEYWEEDGIRTQVAGPTPSVATNDVFIAHGHSVMRTEVARLIERLGLNPIVLHEQPSKGRTIIEKFEEHSHVGFAVAVLTPDDEGRAKDTKDLRPRARQNVIFELGFFVGELGRKRVCALVDKTVERPSDYDGVVFVSLDDEEAWKLRLAKELREAGLEVDLNRLV